MSLTLRVFPEPKSLLSRSPAARLEQLTELWAPMVYAECGCCLGRDESRGVITREQFLRLLDMPEDECS